MEMQAEGAVEQAPTMAGVLEPKAAASPMGEATQGQPPQGTFNGPISTGGEPKQVVNGKLEEGENRLYVSNNGRIVFNDQAQILGGRTPDGTFLPVDAALLYSLSVE